jgi:hypothetical protein
MIDLRAGTGASLGGKLVRSVLRRLPVRRREQLLSELSRQPGMLAALARQPGVLERLIGAAARDAELRGRVVGAASRIDFGAWEQHGWHLTPNRPDSVIPDTGALTDDLWQRRSELVGVDMRGSSQVALLVEAFGRWGAEFNALPLDPRPDGGFYVDNRAFESVDAEVYWILLRASKPRLVLEIGSGWSTVLADQALAANEAEGREGRVLVVEPEPGGMVRELARRSPRVQLAPAPPRIATGAPFDQLKERDILFIDLSHVCKIGSDVQFQILELLPRIRPGVLVHVHDVFLPGEYPRDWVLGPERRFWNEQYLLHAFLAFNRAFEVVWGSAWMHANHPDLLERKIASYRRTARRPGSLWLRRVDG